MTELKKASCKMQICSLSVFIFVENQMHAMFLFNLQLHFTRDFNNFFFIHRLTD